MYTPPSWDEWFMRMAYLVATKSKDPSTKVGAIVVKDKRIISVGYNGMCAGVQEAVDLYPERYERPEKYYWFEHAERNSIFSAAKFGISTDGTIMYTQGIPCADCGRAIIQSGIARVVVHKQRADLDTGKEREKWNENAQRTSIMFHEANVKLDMFDQILGVITFINGQQLSV